MKEVYNAKESVKPVCN